MKKCIGLVFLLFNALYLLSQRNEISIPVELGEPNFGLNNKEEYYTINSTEEFVVFDSLKNLEWKNKASLVIENAKSFLNTPHKIGGYDEKGIDCSGLTKKAFSTLDISLPRTSFEQANVGVEVNKNEIRVGDLVFFKIWKNKISHVGIALENTGEGIKFIHASTSKGVMISNISEDYWKNTFAKAVRVIN